jgi:hypothetical protein
MPISGLYGICCELLKEQLELKIKLKELREENANLKVKLTRADDLNEFIQEENLNLLEENVNLKHALGLDYFL